MSREYPKSIPTNTAGDIQVYVRRGSQNEDPAIKSEVIECTLKQWLKSDYLANFLFYANNLGCKYVKLISLPMIMT